MGKKGFVRKHNTMLNADVEGYSRLMGEDEDATIHELNQLLYSSERRLTRNHGLPGRGWYKHHIYAPGFYTNYGDKTLPGIREAIEIRNFDAVPDQVDIAAEVFDALTRQLTKITELIRRK